MLIHLTTLFPCMVGAVWCIIFLLKYGKEKLHWYFAALALFGAVYLFADACTINGSSSYRTFAYAYIINLFVAPSLSLLCWTYLRSIRAARDKHIAVGYLIAVPTIITSIGLSCLTVVGTKNAEAFARAYEASNSFPAGFTDPIYYIFNYVCIEGFKYLLIAAVAAITMYIIIDLVRSNFTFKGFHKFLFNKEPLKVLHLQDLSILLFLIAFALRGILGRSYFIYHEKFTMFFYFVTGLVCLLICFIASYVDYAEIALSEFFIPRDQIQREKIKFGKDNPEDMTMEDESIMNEDDEEDYSEDEEEDEEEGYDEGIDPASLEGPVSEDLMKRFYTAFEVDKIYLRSGLTIKDVCEMIGSNKTYVSKIVNEKFQMTFPQYINHLRVEHAKQYILDHPDAKQDIIAEESGFPNAAAFNRGFKKDANTTPRIWLAKHKKR